MEGKFATLFGLAKELGMSIEELRLGATGWTGEASLRSLKPKQLREYQQKLKVEISQRFKTKRAGIQKDFESNALLTETQRNYLIDLITFVFNDMVQFRVWLRRFFAPLQTERFLDRSQAQRVMKALADMKKRKYQA